MRLLLIRHPPVAVPKGTCYGRSDVPLSMSPERAAGALAARLRAWLPRRWASMPSALAGRAVVPASVTIATSSSSRCRDVAAVLALRLGLSFTEDDRLREMDFGAWELQPWQAIDRVAIDAWAADLHRSRVHGGETLDEFDARLACWLRQSGLQADASRHDDPEPRRSTQDARVHIVITHAGVIRLLAARLLARAPAECLAWPLAYDGLCALDSVAPAQWRIAAWNRLD